MAENKDAATASTTEQELRGVNILGKVVAIIVIVWLVSMSYVAFGFFVIGMGFSFVALLLDRAKGRYASKTIIAMNFVGIMPILFEIALSYERSIAATLLMKDINTWILVYGFTGLGWVMVWAFPQVTQIIFTIRADFKINRLLNEQRSLEKEWGKEVRNNINVGPLLSKLANRLDFDEAEIEQ